MRHRLWFVATTRILLVEDEQPLRDQLRKVLEPEGYTLSFADTGHTGLRLAEAEHPALIVLDVMLPGMNGLDMLRELRAKDLRMPVLMLTARAEDSDKVLGLELGADDYLTKPFSVPEFLARVRALLRRGGGKTDRLESVSFGKIQVDLLRQTMTNGTDTVSLSTHEGGVLRTLAAYKGEPVSRAKILDGVWGADAAPTDRVVDYHVTNLRKKIQQLSGEREPRHILTVHGSGYKLVE